MGVIDLNQYRAALLVQRSEEGVADMFVNMFAEDIRYQTERGWLLWTGSHWQQDKDDTVFQRVRKVSAQLGELILISNFKPHIDAALRAVWRRLLLVPFDAEIPEKEQDPGLADDIIDLEAEGVLRWLVEDAAWWQWFSEQNKGSSGLLPSGNVLDQTLEYQAAEDVGVKPARNTDFAEALRRVRLKDGKLLGKATKSHGVMTYSGIGLHASEYADDPRAGTDEWDDR